MVRSIGRGLLVWLFALELTAARRGWRGLGWLGPARWLLPALALRAAARDAREPRRALAGLAIAALPALALQTAASSLRNATLHPLHGLRPGRYPDRSVTRLDILLEQGALPALYIVPAGGARAAVCKLHGSGDDKTELAWLLVDRLIARGIAVLLVDMDGHGENPRPQSYPAMLENASAPVAWLRARHVRVGLVGVSLGGAVAARAVADGVAVDALAVVESPPWLAFSRGDMAWEALALLQPAVADLLRDGSFYHLLRAGFGYAPIRAAISTWDLFDALDLPGSLPRIAGPLLLLYGGRDAIVKPDQVEAVRAALPPSAVFQRIPSASHLTLMLRPDALDLLAGWLATNLAA